MKQKLLLLILVFVIHNVYGQNKEITMPILQTPTNDCFLAFTTGFDVNHWGDQDYSLFKSITVYNENGIVGNYTTNKGEYVSFHFIGGTNDSNADGKQTFWCESKQMAFYCNWNENKLSAFVINEDCLYLIDLETDNILADFPLVTHNQTSPRSLYIMVYSGRLSSTAIHRFVINSEGSVKIYESLPNQQNNENNEYVDLGLPSGLLWGTHNIGASNPENYGKYYAWGETSDKSSYLFENYKWNDGSGYTKYNNDSEMGYVDNLYSLENTDDAAYCIVGSSWSIPTKADFDELIANCTTSRTTINGVNGLIISGPNGNSIFLPSAGFKAYESNNHLDEWGYYSTRELYYNDTDKCVLFMFDDSSTHTYWTNIRWYGYSIRPVYRSTSNISTTRITNNYKEKMYNISGHRLNHLEHGINIVVGNDGSAKKILK